MSVFQDGSRALQTSSHTDGSPTQLTVTLGTVGGHSPKGERAPRVLKFSLEEMDMERTSKPT